MGWQFPAKNQPAFPAARRLVGKAAEGVYGAHEAKLRDAVHRASILQPNGPRPLSQKIDALDAAINDLVDYVRKSTAEQYVNAMQERPQPVGLA